MDASSLNLQESLLQEESGILRRADYTVQVDAEENTATGLVAGGWGQYALRFVEGDWTLAAWLGDANNAVDAEGAAVHEETFLNPAQFPSLPERLARFPRPSKNVEDDMSAPLEQRFRSWFSNALVRAENRVLFTSLESSVPGLRVFYAGGHLPFGSEGWLHGLPYHFSYRMGQATLLVRDHNSGEPLYEATTKFGGPYDGSLDKTPDGNFADLFKGLVRSLTKAKFRWEFEITYNDNAPENLRGAIAVLPLSGHTPAEAIHYILNPRTEEQKEAAKTFVINPVPLNQDTRVFPDPAPDFVVTESR